MLRIILFLSSPVGFKKGISISRTGQEFLCLFFPGGLGRWLYFFCRGTHFVSQVPRKFYDLVLWASLGASGCFLWTSWVFVFFWGNMWTVFFFAFGW